MNHASAVPDIGDKRSSVKPEVFSDVEIIEKATEKRIGKQNGRASHAHTPASARKGSSKKQQKTPTNGAIQDDASAIAKSVSDQTDSNVAAEVLEAACEIVEAVEALDVEEVLESQSESGLESSLERLRRSSQALNQFADGLRKQYDLDETEQPGIDASAAIQAESVQAEFEEVTSESVEATEESGVQLHENVPEKYLRYSRIGNTQDDGPFRGRGLLESTSRFFLQAFKQPDVFAQHYTNFAKELLNIVQSRSSLEPQRTDKRFRDAVWRDNFLYRSLMQTYLAWDKEVSGWVEDLDMDDADRRRSRFLYEQLSAMLAPTNSPLNPVAVKRAYQTGGKSVVTGLKHLIDDIQNNHGMPSQVLAGSYTVGEDLGISPGAVVYRSEVLELIQYQMEEGQVVSERPVLIVPPQLNKFYVFDLTPKNSIVKYLQSQGVQPFIISWRNPSKHHAEWNLDRYVSELESAIEVMCEVTGSDQINLASACAGGLTSMALLGYLEAANKPLVHSHSMFVTALQADESFQLGLFASRQSVEMSRKVSQMTGFMDGKSLSHIFAWLRPTDLVWNFWINNYLLGKEPPAMDVLYWDNDSTRLPAGLHSDFLDLFLKDAFANPNTLVVKGYPIDVKKLTMDFYCVGGDEDYLMPWKKCFEAPDLVDGKCTFVLSNSGHIQSVLRPPGIANTFYYTNDEKSADADQWLETATKNNGSWWEHWTNWIQQRSGSQCFAPERLGSDQNPPLSPAPGLYVNEKVS